MEPNIDSGENAQYSISFQGDLTDGIYSIYGEDDAGNISIIDPDQTYTIDQTKPVLPRIDLLNTDSGKSDSDLLTNNVTPVIVFSAEQGLNITIENITTSTFLESDSFSSNFITEEGEYNYVLFSIRGWRL